jgi:DnaJ-class molecular chaperone
MDFRDYYRTLGVGRDASEQAIRAAFRKLARQHHPDVNPGDPEAEARFKAINEAHEVLRDPEKRKLYDRFGADWQRYQQAQAADGDPGAGADFAQWFTGGAVGPRPDGQRGAYRGFGAEGPGGDFSDFFASLFGDGARAGRAGPRRGADQEVDVEITLEEADRGTTRLLALQSTDRCPTCGGAGATREGRCPTCGGDGYVAQTRRVEARIPAGVGDGARVRLAGQGGRGDADGPAGDLYLRVRLLPHARFARDGADLTATVDVPLDTAALGGEVPVATLGDERVALRIPPETQNGRVFRLRGKGLRRGTGEEARGDLLARVNVVLPTGLDERERALFTELRERRGRRAAHTGGRS